MAIRTIYTRAYSERSAGQLVSGKGPKGDPLSDIALAEEFLNHADKWNRTPTALVSVSDLIVDTLNRAFCKHYEDDESPADIWIVFIELAEECGLLDPNKFCHEVVFEWAIPEKYVLHQVSLQTLIERGLRAHYFLRLFTPEEPYTQEEPFTEEVPCTEKVRCYTAQKFQRHGPWEIGIILGLFAQKFGARAPLDWISHQFFRDCVKVKILKNDVRLNYAHEDTDYRPWRTEKANIRFIRDLEDGIETALYDRWLLDTDFFLDCEEFREWRDMMKDSMTRDLIELLEAWHDVDAVGCDGIMKELSAEDKLSYAKEEKKLSIEHEKKRADIEAEAVTLGL